jgi:flagellar biosynthesis protein FlhB
MAGDKDGKTEKPTPKRKREARERGQVARSPDVGGWAAVLLGSFLLPWMFQMAKNRVLAVTNDIVPVMRHPTVPGALSVLGTGLLQVVYYGVTVGATFALLGVVVNLAEVGRATSLKAAAPQLSRLSPKAGIKRLASPNTLWELAKQLLKLSILAGVGYGALRGLTIAVAGTAPVSLSPILDYTAGSLLRFIRTVALLGLLLGLADYGVQRYRLNQSMKMTKQEVKDEHRQSEGDPTMKGQLKRKQYLIARSRMMAAVKTADVVVANPTHFAVALRYQPSKGGAPRVVAKGADGMAARIRDEASTHGVPVVEDPPLARYLFAVCDVDQQIPGAVYVAVAQVIAFVYSLSPGTRGIGVHRRPHSLVPTVDPAEPPPAVAQARRRRRAQLARRQPAASPDGAGHQASTDRAVADGQAPGGQTSSGQAVVRA